MSPAAAATADLRMNAIGPFLDLLRCPVGGAPLRATDRALVSGDGKIYPIDDSGVALFAEAAISADAKVQQQHYDRIADAYVTNLGYPHTKEYTAYLDQALLSQLPAAGLG